MLWIIIIVLICLWVLLPKESTPAQTTLVRFHICLRTKNAENHIEEIIKHHFHGGATSMSIYDDNDGGRTYDLYQKLRTEGFSLYYQKATKNKKNENVDIEHCFKTHYASSDFIMNLDDDEYLYVRKGSTCPGSIIKILREYDHCVALPIHFFGTGGIDTMHPNTSTLSTFIKRDADVKKKRYKHMLKKNLEKDVKTLPRHFYMYHTDSARTIKKRPYKAIFKNENLEEIISKKRAGALIHGFKMGCHIPSVPKLGVAHYTRSIGDLSDRMEFFWKDTVGLRRRFNTEHKRNNYIMERDRSAQIDRKLSHYSSFCDD